MTLPAHLLYATSARIGGSGLDSVAHETLRGAVEAGCLGRALAYDLREKDIPSAKVRNLRWHPVRLLSALDRPHYYGAKKHCVDRLAARELRSGRFDLFHGWSGECVRSLREAKKAGIPCLIEVPTWHRNKGRPKPAMTKTERAAMSLTGWQGWKQRLLVSRQQQLEEYDLADLILVLSEKAAETFRAAGVPDEKLFHHARGVDVERFTPASASPDIFRVVFVGALIKRKGVHHLLAVWRKLALKNAELVLVGSVHPEIQPYLHEFGGNDVQVPGFVGNVEECYRASTVHVFPSTCEGSAKCTYEAAACGLPQITTRESGDVVRDGENGIIIPCGDQDALAAALLRLYGDRDLCAILGAAGRERVVRHFTWAHFRERLCRAWEQAMQKGGA